MLLKAQDGSAACPGIVQLCQGCVRGDKSGSSLPTKSCYQGGVTMNAFLSFSRCLRGCFTAPPFLRECSCSSCQYPFLTPRDGDGNHSPKLSLQEYLCNSQGLEAPESFPAIAGIWHRAPGAVQTPLLMASPTTGFQQCLECGAEEGLVFGSCC